MDELKQIFAELAHAVKTGDVEMGVSALREFFEVCESEPHKEEGMANGGEVDEKYWEYGDVDSDDDSAQEDQSEYFGERY